MEKPSYYHRLEADYLNKIEIWWLKEAGWLTPSKVKSSVITWRHGENENSIRLSSWLRGNLIDCVKFTYIQKHKNGIEEFDYKVPLVTTPCNYGGVRYWFECIFCQRRVGILYMRGSYFACRHCQYLTYESKKLSGRYKWAGKIISEPDVEKSRKAVKRKYYNGKMTRKYEMYLSKRQKFMTAWWRNIAVL